MRADGCLASWEFFCSLKTLLYSKTLFYSHPFCTTYVLFAQDPTGPLSGIKLASELGPLISELWPGIAYTGEKVTNEAFNLLSKRVVQTIEVVTGTQRTTTLKD